MTAKKGTSAFTTKESKRSEDRSYSAWTGVLNEPEFSCYFYTKPYYSINEIYETDVATNKVRKYGTYDATTKPDFGVLYMNPGNGDPHRIVAIGDNKYQSSSQNACERVCFYPLDAIRMGLNTKRVLIVFEGPGFEISDMGHCNSGTGKMIARARHHCTVMVNPPSISALKDFYRDFLRNILHEEGVSSKVLVA